MKTKKYIVYVLISLFIFSPFLNLDGWTASRTNPIKQQVQPTWECNWICETDNEVTCCYKYCSDDGFTWYQEDKFCFGDPVSNPPKK